MRYFWHFIITVGFLGLVVFIFFIFSVRVRDNITFTDENTLTAPSVTVADPARGPVSAPVTIINYGDYGCDACNQMEYTLETIEQTFTGQVRIVWKDLPNVSLHPEALNAALAARCAGEQDKFWEYHNALFLNQERLAPEVYPALADQLGLKTTTFDRCYNNQTTLPLVERTYSEGLNLGITATPTLYINGQRFTGLLDPADLEAIIRPLVIGL